MKYLRTYPWGMQLLLFLLFVFTLISLGEYTLSVLLPKFYDVSLINLMQVGEKSSPYLIHLSLVAQGILSIMIFMVPSLLFAYLAHPDPLTYLGLRLPKKPIHLALVVLIIVGAMPVLMAIEALMSHINFGADIKSKQEAAEGIQRAYLTMPTFPDFIRTFTVMAIIPAIGEELFFRGIFMRFTRRKSPNMIVPILFSAGIFAFVHNNYYGLPSIFISGALLAIIYYLTGSIWCGIIAHMFFNGSQIVLSYLGNTNPKAAALVNDTSIQWGLVAGGALLFAGAFYLLWKTRTPLATNWSDDFDRPQNLTTDEDSTIFNQ